MSATTAIRSAWKVAKKPSHGERLRRGWLESGVVDGRDGWELTVKTLGFPKELPSRSPSPSPSSTFGCSGFVDLKWSTKNPETFGWIVHVLGGHPRDNDATCSYFTVTACNSSEEREMRERMHKLSRCPKYSFNQFWSIQEHFVKNRLTQFTLPIQVVKQMSSCERRGRKFGVRPQKTVCSSQTGVFSWSYSNESMNLWHWIMLLDDNIEYWIQVKCLSMTIFWSLKAIISPWVLCAWSFIQCSQCSCFHLF